MYPTAKKEPLSAYTACVGTERFLHIGRMPNDVVYCSRKTNAQWMRGIYLYGIAARRKPIMVRKGIFAMVNASITLLIVCAGFIIFIAAIAIIITSVMRGVGTWNKNNHSPRLTVAAKVVAKRQSTTQHNQPIAGDTSGAHGYHTSVHTTYYVTFEVESGDRIELSLSGTEYGMLAEGDEGRLTFQGTRYLSFER